jgi:hypothetical protein
LATINVLNNLVQRFCLFTGTPNNKATKKAEIPSPAPAAAHELCPEAETLAEPVSVEASISHAGFSH